MRLPPELPRADIHHEPSSTTRRCGCGCGLKRIGEDVSEKLEQASVPAYVIDEGKPTAGILSQVLVAKFADRLMLYRQPDIFARAGPALPRSTMAEWVGGCGLRLQPQVDALKAEILGKSVLHADKTPVQIPKPDAGKVHRAYLWEYTPTSYVSSRAGLYDFAPSRAREHRRKRLLR